MKTARFGSAGICLVVSMTLVFTGCGGSSTTPIQNPNACSDVTSSSPEFLYATAQNQILGFTVNQANGALCSPNIMPGSISTIYPSGGIVSIPSGFVYVSDAQNNQLDGFSVNKNTGALTEISGSPFALPFTVPNELPETVITDPQGKFLYVSNFGAIDGFAIDGTTGSLTALLSSPFLGYYGDITISPNGRFLFATDLGPSTPDGFGAGISAFTIDPGTGTLTLVAGSPFIVPVGDPLSAANIVSLVVDPSSSFVYTVVQWQQHGAQGELTFVYGLSINAATGALIAISNPPIFQPGNNLSSYAIAVSGSLLYVSNDQGVIAFRITPVTGVLTQANRSPFPPGTASGGIVISPDGKFLYQAVNTYGMLDNANMIDVFSLDFGAATSVGSVTTPTGPFILSISKQ